MDTPYRLKKQYTKDKANISTSDGEGLEALLDKEGFIYKKKTKYYSVEVDDIPKLMQVLSEQKDVITDIEIKKGTLNDVFLEITGKDIRK
jgi:ABC-2 type transport system ATP-binding protein